MKKMINVSLALLFVVTITSCGNSQSKKSSENASAAVQAKTQIAKNVGTDEFQQKMKGDVQLIDVRTPEEVAAGAIEGSTPIDFYGQNFQQNLEKLDKEKPVLVYCAVGGRSGQAMQLMKKMGFKEIYNLSGGIRAWKAEGKPVK